MTDQAPPPYDQPQQYGQAQPPYDQHYGQSSQDGQPVQYVQPQYYGAPPPGAPQYGSPQYGQVPAYPKTNTLSIVAIILGFLVPPGGIICGHIALGQIKRAGEGGRGLALTGLIAGYVITGLYALFIVGYIITIIAVLGTVGAVGGYSS